jgi:hypothetical protein
MCRHSLQEAKSRNITLTVPEELAKSMSKFPEVTWSQVAREAIESYVKMREEPDLAPLLQRMAKEKTKEYIVGLAYARELSEKLSYSEFSKLMRNYWDLMDTRINAICAEEGVDPEDVLLTDFQKNYDFISALEKSNIEVRQTNDAFLKGLRVELERIFDKIRDVRIVGDKR